MKSLFDTLKNYNPIYGEVKEDGQLTEDGIRKVTRKKTERGELLLYFSRKIGKPIGYVAMRLTAIPTQDLYYIKSVCDDYEQRNGPWSKCFYGMLKV